MNNNNKNAVFFWSILLVAIGGLFLLRNFGMLNFNFPIKIISWRLIPLIIGINAFLKGKNIKLKLCANQNTVHYNALL